MKMKRRLIFFYFIFFFFFILTQSPPLTTAADYVDIRPKDLIAKIKNGDNFILLDVRTPEEYSEGHLKGAVLIPHTEIQKRYKELGNATDKEIVVYCAVGGRSSKASEALVKLGFKKIKNLAGGIVAWKKIGGEVVVK